jgi:hypothetical protein
MNRRNPGSRLPSSAVRTVLSHPLRVYFTEWKGPGHEDHFMNPEYFALILKAVLRVSRGGTRRRTGR